MDHFGDLDQRFLRDAGNLFSVVERVFFKRFFKFIEKVHFFLDEFLVMPALVDDIFCHRHQPYLVCALVRMDKKIGALCHFVFAHIGNNQFLAVQFMGPFDAGRKDRVGFRRVRADNHDKAG